MIACWNRDTNMHKFVIISHNVIVDYFTAKDDKAAEQYVEENYESDDGEQILYRLTHVMEWG